MNKGKGVRVPMWYRLRRRILETLADGRATYLRRRIHASARSKFRLVMTLLVRDEYDIVKRNIDYHLERGVDFIIATDNGSVDGTDEVLEEYERRGVLRLIREPEHDYSQMKWVNRMADAALHEYGADAIFHCDADEFWTPRSGNLKNELLAAPAWDVLKVTVVNVLLQNQYGDERFPEHATYTVERPLWTDNIQEASKKTSLYLYAYDPKIIFRTRQGALQTNQGNHNIVRGMGQQVTERRSRDIRIYHYPVRSRAHFLEKIVKGGQAYERNTKLGKNVGWQWRRWYGAYKISSEALEQEYEKLILTEEEAQVWANRGVIAIWRPIN